MERNHKYMVVAIMLARANDSVLYTAWYCTSFIAYITIASEALDSRGAVVGAAPRLKTTHA